MKIMDKSGKKVEITMKVWNGSQYSPDWSEDFFNVGGCPYDEDADAYIVEDVDYCIEQAQDWAECRGDFQDDAEFLRDGEERTVFSEEV